MREMVPFGQELCADKNGRFTPIDFLDKARHGSLAPGEVPIDAEHGKRWKECFQRLLNTLGAETNWCDMAVSTSLAVGNVAMHGPAVVTDQGVLLQVIGKFCVTPLTLSNPAASGAHHHGSEASSVQEHQNLVAAVQFVGHRLDQGSGEAAGFFQMPGINQLILFLLRSFRPSRQRQELVLFRFGVVETFQ